MGDPVLKQDGVLGQAAAPRGTPDQQSALRQAAAIAVLKLAQPNDLPQAKRLAHRYLGTTGQKGRLFGLTERVLTECATRVACYVEAVARSDYQEYAMEFAGIKAAFMVGILGDERAAHALATRVEAIESQAVLYCALLAIDHLLPRGSAEVADRLDVVAEAHRHTGDKSRLMLAQPIRQVSYRLRARAEATSP